FRLECGHRCTQMTRTVTAHLDALSAGQSRPDQFIDVICDVRRPYGYLSDRDGPHPGVRKIIKESLDRAGFGDDIGVDLNDDLVPLFDGVPDGVLKRCGFSLSLGVRERR